MDSFNKVLCLYITALFLHSAQALGNKKTTQAKKCITGATEYHSICKSDCFVDKSLLIKDYFTMNLNILVQAPKHFGKTMNLRMLEAFLKMEDKTDAHGLTKGCSLFKQHNLNIHRYKDGSFFNTHCGKYPVLFICFAGVTATDLSDIVDSFRFIIQNVFEEHKYLLKSADIEDKYKKKYKKYRQECFSLSTSDIQKAFPFITKMMRKHFKRNLTVLLDDYDVPVWEMIKSDIDMEHAAPVAFFVAEIIFVLLEQNEDVERSFLTSSLRVPTVMTGNYFEILPFLRNHTLAKYYGLTTREVKKLLADFNLKARYEDVKYYYKGYMTDPAGDTIYSTWSIMNYLQSGELGNYWTAAKVLRQLDLIFMKQKRIRKKIVQLLDFQDISLKCRSYIKADDIMFLQCVEKNQDTCFTAKPTKYHAFMYENGYLTPLILDQDVISISIPNRETYDHLYDAVYSAVYFKRKLKLWTSKTDEFINAIITLGVSNDTQETLATLKRSLANLFTKATRPRDHATLVGTIYYCLSASKGFIKTKANVAKELVAEKYADLVSIRSSDSAGLIIKVKYSNKPATSKQALQDIVDLHHDVLDQVPFYRGHVKRRIYISLSFPKYKSLSEVDEDLVAICCLIDSKNIDETMCV